MGTGMDKERYKRQVAFFGAEGQEKLRRTSVVVIGAGGTGSHVIQQLAFMGVGTITIIDPDELEESNRNRLIGSRSNDPAPGTPKVEIASRLISETNPEVSVQVLKSTFLCKEGFEIIRNADWVFGCVDNEGARLVLTELCAAYSRPYIDLATQIHVSEKVYGGRICVAHDGNGCLSCYEEIDTEEASRDLAGPDEQKVREELYGVPADQLDGSGPAVVTLNGVVASIACTEFLLAVAGVREPVRLLKYNSIWGVTRSNDTPSSDCYYCKGIWGKGSDGLIFSRLTATQVHKPTLDDGVRPTYN